MPASRIRVATCVHWWEIESPNGRPMLRGVCRLCGETRKFEAAFGTEFEFNNETPNQRLSGRKASQIVAKWGSDAH